MGGISEVGLAAALSDALGSATIGTIAAGGLEGAGIGGLSSLVTGGNVGKGALFGGLTGGLGGGISAAGGLTGLGDAAGGLFGDATLGTDIGNGISGIGSDIGNGFSDLFGDSTSAGTGGAPTIDSGVDAARSATADAATSGSASPLAGVTGGGTVPSVGGGSAGGFVNAPDVSPLGDIGQIGSSATPNLSPNGFDFGAASTGDGTFASANPISTSDITGNYLPTDSIFNSGAPSVSSNNNPMFNGLLRSGLTSLFTNTNQKGYAGENAAAQQAAQAYQPFLKNGTQASNTLASLFGNNGAAAEQGAQQNFQNTPGYQFALNQGLNAVTNSAAAKGNLLSGNAQEALNNYAQGQANQTYNQYVQNQQQLAGQGAQAAGGYGSALVGGANALAQGGQASANNQNQGVGGAISSLFPGNDILSLLKGNYGNSGILSSLFS